MIFMLRPFFFLLLLVSCGSLSHKMPASLEQSLSAVPMTGEGRGRVGIKGQQYVFSYDAILKENSDWLLSASIPLHGEEFMIFPDLKKVSPPVQEESFEKRIELMFTQEVKAKTSSERLIQELRGLIRFMLSAKLNLKRECVGELCNGYVVKDVAGKKISVEKVLSPGEVLTLEGENFEGSHFMRTNFFLTTAEGKIFSLELLWK